MNPHFLHCAEGANVQFLLPGEGSSGRLSSTFKSVRAPKKILLVHLLACGLIQRCALDASFAVIAEKKLRLTAGIAKNDEIHIMGNKRGER